MENQPALKSVLDPAVGNLFVQIVANVEIYPWSVQTYDHINTYASQQAINYMPWLESPTTSINRKEKC